MLKKTLFLFVSLFLLYLFPLLFSQENKLIVTAERANIYLDPDINSPIIDTVKKGAVLTLFLSGKVKGSWYYVLLTDKRREISKPGFTQASSVELMPEFPKIIKEEKKQLVFPLPLSNPSALKRIESQRERENRPESFKERDRRINPYLVDWASSLYHCGKWRKALVVYGKVLERPAYTSSQKSEVREIIRQIKKEYGPSVEFDYQGISWPGGDYVHGLSIETKRPLSEKNSLYIKIIQRYYDVGRRSFDKLGTFVSSKEAIQIDISLRHHISRFSYLQGSVGGYKFLSHSYHNGMEINPAGDFDFGLKAYLAGEKGERLHLSYSHHSLWDDPLNIVYFQGEKSHFSGDFGLPLKDYLEIGGGGGYYWYKGQEWTSGHQENFWGDISLKLHLEHPELLMGYHYHYIHYRVDYKLEESFPDIYSLYLHSFKSILRDSLGENFGFEINLSLGRDFIRETNIYEAGFSLVVKPKPGHEIMLSGSYLSEAIQPGQGNLLRLGLSTRHYF